MKIKRKFKIPIFFGELVVEQTKDFEGRFKYYCGESDQHKSIGAAFIPSISKKGYHRYVILFRKEVTVSIVSHEVCHAVNCILHDRGIITNNQNDEVQAYLTGWVTNKVFKSIKCKL